MNLTGTIPAKIERKQKLMSAISFNQHDLDLNDGGFLSENQIMNLKPKIDLAMWLSAIVSFFCFSLALIGFFVDRMSALTSVFVVLFGVSFYLIIWSSNKKSRLLKGFGVKKIEGRLKLEINYAGKENVPVYLMRINGITFQLDEKTYDAFDEGDHRVYYYRLIKNELISAEPLS